MTDTNDTSETSRTELTLEQRQTLATALNASFADDLFDTDTEWERTHFTITINDFALPKTSNSETPEYTSEFSAQVEQKIASALEDIPILADQAATVTAELWNATDEQYDR